MCLLIKKIKSVIWSRGHKGGGRESVPCGECSCDIGTGITDLSKNLTKVKYPYANLDRTLGIRKVVVPKIYRKSEMKGGKNFAWAA